MASIKDNVLELDGVIIKLNKNLDDNINKLNAGAAAVDAYNKKLSAVPSQFQKSLVEIKQKTDEVTASKQKLDATEKQAIKTAKQMEQASIKESNARNALLKQKEREIAKNKQLESAYLQLAKAEAEAARKVQDIIARGRTADQTQKQYNATLKQAQTQFDQLRAKLLLADNATGRWSRTNERSIVSIKGLGTGLRQLMSAFGLFSGLYLAVAAIRDAFRTIKDFDKANADLAATMGVTRKQITDLTNDQKRLGATTKFTATEVAGLQKEFAKLGFNQKEILNATEATLNLAAAVDTDLANAAMVAGATLRGFGLDASEMNRVTDVMASSFTKSALDISNFTESMKYVAPIAGTTGVSIEFATAMLGKLADAGVKGSQAGTSLRRILTEMAKTGLPAAQAFDKVAKSGISVTDAMDEVGRTAQTALLVLSKSKDGVNELNEALLKAGGSAKRMAEEQLKSLEGQMTLLSSAWDGFVLGLNKGESVLTKILTGVVEALREAVVAWDYLLATSSEKAKKLNEIQFDKGASDFNKIQESINNKYERRENLLKRIAELNKLEKTETSKTLIKNTQDRIDLLDKQIQQEEMLFNVRVKSSIEADKKAQQSIKLQQSEILERIYFIKEQMSLMKDQDAAEQKYGASLKSNKDKLKELNQAMSYYNGRITAANKLTKGDTQVLNENSNATASNTKEKKKNAKARKEVRFALIGTLEWFENLKNQLTQEQRTLAQNTEKWKEYQAKIDQVEESIKRLKGVVDSSEGISLDFSGDDIMPVDEWSAIVIEEGDKLRDILKEHRQSFVDEFKDNSGFSKLFYLIENFDTLKESGVDTALAISEAFQQAFNTIAEFSQANFDAEYSRLEQQKEFAIQFAGESTTAKEEIERQYEERKKQIQRREAQAQKQLAIFNAVIDTAQAVVAALPNYALATAVGVLGAAQIALISSQPIPEFWRGTDNAPEGLAWTQERGAEVITDKKGNIKTLGSDKGAQLTYLSKGDKVYKSHEDYINKQLSKNGIQELGSYLNISPKVINEGITKEDLQENFSKLANVIKKKDNITINVDKRGVTPIVNGNTILNSRLTIKSRQV